MAKSEEVPLPYDAAIVSLQSSGTQYISLPLNASPGDFLQVELDLKIVTATNASYPLCGHKPQFYMSKYNDTLLSSTVGENAASGGIGYVKNERCEILLSTEGKRGVNGNYIENQRPLTSSITSVEIFKAVSDNSKPNFVLYACKWTLNNKLIYDLIPVRVEQTGYLYDKVSRQLFGNAGTGNFTLGADIT